MDGIKVFASSKRDINSLIHHNRILSDNTGMLFGLNKCDRMADVQDSYKYLDISQVSGNHDEDSRMSATAKYLQKVRRAEKPAEQ